jgi:hypothetical protein
MFCEKLKRYEKPEAFVLCDLSERAGCLDRMMSSVAKDALRDDGV